MKSDLQPACRVMFLSLRCLEQNGSDRRSASERYNLIMSFCLKYIHRDRNVFVFFYFVKGKSTRIGNSFCSFYNTDGSCTIGVDNNHYFIIDYDYLAGGYSVRTYAEKSANGYTVTDKQRLARGEIGKENK